MTEDEARTKLDTDEAFAYAKRYDYSMRKLEERYPEPEGAPDNIIATALMIQEDQVESAYQKVALKLRALMGVEV